MAFQILPSYNFFSVSSSSSKVCSLPSECAKRIDTNHSTNWPSFQKVQMFAKGTKKYQFSQSTLKHHQLLIQPSNESIEKQCLHLQYLAQDASSKLDQNPFKLELFYLLDLVENAHGVSALYKQLITSIQLDHINDWRKKRVCFANFIRFQSKNFTLLVEAQPLNPSLAWPKLLLNYDLETNNHRIESKVLNFLLPFQSNDDDIDDDKLDWTQNWNDQVDSFTNHFEFDEDHINFSGEIFLSAFICLELKLFIFQGNLVCNKNESFKSSTATLSTKWIRYSPILAKYESLFHIKISDDSSYELQVQPQICDQLAHCEELKLQQSKPGIYSFEISKPATELFRLVFEFRLSIFCAKEEPNFFTAEFKMLYFGHPCFKPQSGNIVKVDICKNKGVCAPDPFEDSRVCRCTDAFYGEFCEHTDYCKLLTSNQQVSFILSGYKITTFVFRLALKCAKNSI